MTGEKLYGTKMSFIFHAFFFWNTRNDVQREQNGISSALSVLADLHTTIRSRKDVPHGMTREGQGLSMMD